MMTAILGENTGNFDICDMAARLFDEVAALSRDVEGVSRPAFSRTETDTLEHLLDFARQEGLVATWDAGNNLVFSLPEHANSEHFVLIGSHVDSVPHGGNYDGLAGVLAGILCLVRARRERKILPQSVKVIALRGEESAWFGPCYIGSKALLGVLTHAELAAPHKGDGRVLHDHIAALGVDMERVRKGKPLIDQDTIIAYLELHIEQGPVLIERNLPAAIVSGIRGNFRYKKIACFGEAGHSGAVPLAYRHDPVLAMAELLNVLDVAWHGYVADGRDLVVTSGMVSTDQKKHALSRIPDNVEFSLDVRSQDHAMLSTMHDVLMAHVRRIENERNVRFDLGPALWTSPALCSKAVVEALCKGANAAGIRPEIIPSGGGHDAAVFAGQGVPSGMIFVRNRNGSHNPQEAMDIEDFAVATSILYNSLLTDSSLNDPTPGNVHTEKDPDLMFNRITDIIRENGNGVRAYRAAAQFARHEATADPERATGYFMLGIAAQEFADTHYGEALHANICDQELARFDGFVSLLDGAFMKDDLQARLGALADVALSLSLAQINQEAAK